jgi:hypothetical protein
MRGPSFAFEFNFDEVDPETRSKANLRLVELLTLAPPGAKAVGVMDKEGQHYISAIEVSSPYRTFFQKALGSTPQAALQRVLDRLEDTLYRWRYGGGNQGSPSHTDLHFSRSQTQ